METTITLDEKEIQTAIAAYVSSKGYTIVPNGFGVSINIEVDCLYKYREHWDWWNRFFDITRKLNMLVDVHTRESFYYAHFWNRINRCVFSSDLLSEDKRVLEYMLHFTKIRITHLVTADTTLKMIEDYLGFQRKTGCQFTIKELIGHDDQGRYKEIREKYPAEIYHLDAGDYNIYYMPDNSIRESFLPAKEG